MTFTYIVFFDCITGEALSIFQEYGLTYPQAQDAAKVVEGQFSEGYFYQPDYHIFSPLTDNKCTAEEWWCCWTPAEELPPQIKLSGTLTSPDLGLIANKWEDLTKADGEYYENGQSAHGITPSWTTDNNLQELKYKITINTADYEMFDLIFISMTSEEYTDPATAEPKIDLYNFQFLIWGRFKICMKGTREELEALGYEIINGPWNSRAGCEENCSQ